MYRNYYGLVTTRSLLEVADLFCGLSQQLYGELLGDLINGRRAITLNIQGSLDIK